MAKNTYAIREYGPGSVFMEGEKRISIPGSDNYFLITSIKPVAQDWKFAFYIQKLSDENYML